MVFFFAFTWVWDPTWNTILTPENCVPHIGCEPHDLDFCSVCGLSVSKRSRGTRAAAPLPGNPPQKHTRLREAALDLAAGDFCGQACHGCTLDHTLVHKLLLHRGSIFNVHPRIQYYYYKPSRKKNIAHFVPRF